MNVDVVSYCTNHSLDFRKEGMEETYNHLEKAGIKYFGSGNNLEEFKKTFIDSTKKSKTSFN